MNKESKTCAWILKCQSHANGDSAPLTWNALPRAVQEVSERTSFKNVFFFFFFFFFFVHVLLPSSRFSVTLDTLRLIHKTPTSTPNVTFPQLRRDDAPHLPDTGSSRMSTSRFKKVGIFFFCCLLENGWGNPVETSCFETLTAGVVGKEYYPSKTFFGNTILKFTVFQYS